MSDNRLGRHKFHRILWGFEAYFRLWWVRYRLSRRGMPWLRNYVVFGQGVSSAKQSIEQNISMTTMKESVRLASRLHSSGTQCLHRSLALKLMLEARSIRARVLIGVNKRGDAIASHAWLEAYVGDHWLILGEPEVIANEFKLM